MMCLRQPPLSSGVSVHVSSELSSQVKHALERRAFVVLLTVALLITSTGLIVAAAILKSVPGYALEFTFVVVFVVTNLLILYLLFSACPSCGKRVAKPFHIWFWPAPEAFVSTCAHCGVSMRVTSPRVR